MGSLVHRSFRVPNYYQLDRAFAGFIFGAVRLRIELTARKACLTFDRVTDGELGTVRHGVWGGRADATKACGLLSRRKDGKPGPRLVGGPWLFNGFLTGKFWPDQSQKEVAYYPRRPPKFPGAHFWTNNHFSFAAWRPPQRSRLFSTFPRV